MGSQQDLAPVLTPVDVPGIASITGGAGGIRFQWEELDKGARIVDEAAAELRRIEGSVSLIDAQLGSLQTTLNGAFPALPGIAASSGAAALEGLGAARQRIAQGSSELVGVADKIRLSRFGYELTEALVSEVVGRARSSQELSLPFISPPLSLQHTRTEETELDGTVDNLLEQAAHAGAEPGAALEVIEVNRETGASYVVVIPGTEGTSWENPFSPVGIGEAALGKSEHVNDAAVRALEQVGAEQGADVILLGYSQGGMHAMNMANSGPLREKYSVEMVVTAGSPVSLEATAEETLYLHLAHEEDAIPNLDPRPAQDHANQVSVVLDHNVEPPVGEQPLLGASHRLGSYQEGARAVDASDHPSLVPITSALGSAVAGASAKRHVFEVTRPPLIGSGQSGGQQSPGVPQGPGSPQAPGPRSAPRAKTNASFL